MDLLSAIAGSDAAGVLTAIQALIENGQSTGQICDLLIENMRDLMVFLCAGPDTKVLVLTADEQKQMAELTKSFDVPALIYNITALEKLRWTLRTSETSRALLEALVLRLALSEHFMSLFQLTAQNGGRTPTVKKKSIVSGSNPTPETMAGPAPTVPHIQATIDSIQACWDTMIKTIAQSDASLGQSLQRGAPVSLRNSVLDIQFGSEGQSQFAKSICERKIAVLQQGLSQVLGVSISIRFSEDRRASHPEQKVQLTEKPNNFDRSEVLNDPTVQMVLKGLDAVPVDIKKMAVEEPDEEQHLTEETTE